MIGKTITIIGPFYKVIVLIKDSLGVAIPPFEKSRQWENFVS
jgi:hypothetical protein